MATDSVKRIVLKIHKPTIPSPIPDYAAEVNRWTNPTATDPFYKVTCAEKLLGEGNNCYILYVLAQQDSLVPKDQEKRFVLVVWNDGTNVQDNVADLNDLLNDGWTIKCAENLLANPDAGLCYVLYVLQPK